jgi:RNA polymerase sigma-70 factor (ECF subfamily)|tara:strand:- start:5363 stop:5914 length:552 start_codon:yes stop_codon:yes gene_type:complete
VSNLKSKLISDEELIRRCKESDQSAQKMLFEKYANRMMAVCMRYCKNRDDAKDLLQDGFYKVYVNIGKFKGDSKIDTWMTRVFINLALNQQRQGRNKYSHFEFDPALETAAAEETPAPENIEPETVLEALSQLPEIYKIVLNLYAVENMSHKEIAKKLGISVGSSKSRLSRGRVMLNTLLNRK